MHTLPVILAADVVLVMDCVDECGDDGDVHVSSYLIVRGISFAPSCVGGGGCCDWFPLRAEQSAAESVARAKAQQIAKLEELLLAKDHALADAEGTAKAQKQAAEKVGEYVKVAS